MKKINIALVGLGFGGSFAEIYKSHPYVGTISLFDTDRDLMKKVSDYYNIPKTYDPLNPQESLKKGAGAGHHGSHAHLVHEFVGSIVEGRKPWVDEVLGGNITGACVCAHESAMNNGAPVVVPEY